MRILTWAMPKLPGVDGKRSTTQKNPTTESGFYCPKRAAQHCPGLINCPGGLLFYPMPALGRILALAQIF